MKIALLGPDSALVQSLSAAAQRTGHTLAPAADGAEIERQAPDFVIAASSAHPKLHDVPQYTVVHEPRDVFLGDRARLVNLLSADGYFAISHTLERFIRDLTWSTGRPQEPGLFFPSPARQGTASGDPQPVYCPASAGDIRDDLVPAAFFEIVAHGFSPICADIPWLRRYFGDSIDYVDPWLPDPFFSRQVLLRETALRADPAAARIKAARAREIFEQTLAAEVLLMSAAAHHQQVSTHRQNQLAAAKAPLISIIMRCGGRSAEFVRRAIGSLSRQTYGRFDVILVRHSDADLGEISLLRPPNIESIHIVDSQPGFRSTSLCAGLAAVRGEYFAILDDDDWLFSNHFERLFHPLAQPKPQPYFAYSGTLRSGPDGRAVTHFGIQDTSDLFTISSAFCSHCFVASADLIHPGLLEDPRLVTSEDSYLILSLLRHVDPLFSYAVTAVQDVASAGRSNYDRDPRRFEDLLTVRLRLRGANLPRPGLAAFDGSLQEFWRSRPARQPAGNDIYARLPEELLELVAPDFRPSGDAIATPPHPWAYAAQFAPPIPRGRAGHGFFRAELLVESGPIGIGVLNPAASDFLIRVPVQASPEPQTVFLPIEDIGKTGHVVIQNWDTPGVHSLHLRSIALWGVASPRPAK